MTDIFTPSDAQFIKSELARDLKAVTDAHEKQFLEVLQELKMDGEIAGMALGDRLEWMSGDAILRLRAVFKEVRFDWQECNVVAVYRTEGGAHAAFTPEEIARAMESGRLRSML